MDTLNQEYFCKLFIDSDLDKISLGKMIVNFIQGISVDQSSMYNNSLYIFYKINDNSNDKLKLDKIDGFLFYQYELEIYSQNNITCDIYIKNLKNLLDFLRKNKIKTIPVCFDNIQINGQNIEDYLNDGQNYTKFMS